VKIKFVITGLLPDAVGDIGVRRLVQNCIKRRVGLLVITGEISKKSSYE
jgi:hypothetical protein